MVNNQKSVESLGKEPNQTCLPSFGHAFGMTLPLPSYQKTTNTKHSDYMTSTLTNVPVNPYFLFNNFSLSQAHQQLAILNNQSQSKTKELNKEEIKRGSLESLSNGTENDKDEDSKSSFYTENEERKNETKPESLILKGDDSSTNKSNHAQQHNHHHHHHGDTPPTSVSSPSTCSAKSYSPDSFPNYEEDEDQTLIQENKIIDESEESNDTRLPKSRAASSNCSNRTLTTTTSNCTISNSSTSSTPRDCSNVSDKAAIIDETTSEPSLSVNKNNSLIELLARANLAQYLDTFIEQGGDDLNQLCEADEQEFKEICDLVGMSSKPLHVKRLRKAIDEHNNKLSSNKTNNHQSNNNKQNEESLNLFMMANNNNNNKFSNIKNIDNGGMSYTASSLPPASLSSSSSSSSRSSSFSSFSISKLCSSNKNDAQKSKSIERQHSNDILTKYHPNFYSHHNNNNPAAVLSAFYPSIFQNLQHNNNNTNQSPDYQILSQLHNQHLLLQKHHGSQQQQQLNETLANFQNEMLQKTWQINNELVANSNKQNEYKYDDDDDEDNYDGSSNDEISGDENDENVQQPSDGRKSHLPNNNNNNNNDSEKLAKKNMVIELYNNGERCVRKLNQLTGVPLTTVYRIIGKLKGINYNIPRGNGAGRKTILDGKDRDILVEILNVQPRISRKALGKELEKLTGKSIHNSTLNRELCRLRHYGHTSSTMSIPASIELNPNKNNLDSEKRNQDEVPRSNKKRRRESLLVTASASASTKQQSSPSSCNNIEENVFRRISQVANDLCSKLTQSELDCNPIDSFNPDLSKTIAEICRQAPIDISNLVHNNDLLFKIKHVIGEILPLKRFQSASNFYQLCLNEACLQVAILEPTLLTRSDDLIHHASQVLATCSIFQDREEEEEIQINTSNEKRREASFENSKSKKVKLEHH